ncbi:hypothetical protein E2C01_061178 [Portunus trituberculatus]|uniref:Secreted protein n=1 Tax=Portunus trituberculatus TaxID=210409 RepID=A0A5B7HDP0_PORTR|nr:hypothetical protein [Portunus trituberculatus]
MARFITLVVLTSLALPLSLILRPATPLTRSSFFRYVTLAHLGLRTATATATFIHPHLAERHPALAESPAHVYLK